MEIINNNKMKTINNNDVINQFICDKNIIINKKYYFLSPFDCEEILIKKHNEWVKLGIYVYENLFKNITRGVFPYLYLCIAKIDIGKHKLIVC